MIVGYFILSIGCLFFFIASLPEIIDSVIIAEGISEENHSLNDKASGVFNGFVAFGAILAPIVGGSLSDAIGYQSSNDILALASCIYTVVFAAVSLSVYKKYKRMNTQHHHSVMKSDSSYRLKATSRSRRFDSSWAGRTDRVGSGEEAVSDGAGD